MCLSKKPNYENPIFVIDRANQMANKFPHVLWMGKQKGQYDEETLIGWKNHFWICKLIFIIFNKKIIIYCSI